jgi:hypothetical protein
VVRRPGKVKDGSAGRAGRCSLFAIIPRAGQAVFAREAAFLRRTRRFRVGERVAKLDFAEFRNEQRRANSEERTAKSALDGLRERI